MWILSFRMICLDSKRNVTEGLTRDQGYRAQIECAITACHCETSNATRLYKLALICILKVRSVLSEIVKPQIAVQCTIWNYDAIKITFLCSSITLNTSFVNNNTSVSTCYMQITLLFCNSFLHGTRINLINKAVNSFKIHGDNTGIFFLFVNCMWFKWLSPQNPLPSQTLSVINNLDFAAYCSIQIKALLQIFNL